jgi:starch phosphorylase
VATQAGAPQGARRVYYLSMEFLMGRTLGNALAALELQAPGRPAAGATRVHARGRRAARGRRRAGQRRPGPAGRVFPRLDGHAGLPSFGYGIRYEYGMFAQTSSHGRQVEHPDPWLGDGSPWEFPRPGVHYPVRFGGWVEPRARTARCRCGAPRRGQRQGLRHGGARPRHATVSTLRLWKAAAPAHIDLHAFNSGDYARAAEFKNEFENISWVLYPNDSTPAGRELRLRQEYFFTSASSRTSSRAT